MKKILVSLVILLGALMLLPQSMLKTSIIDVMTGDNIAYD